MAGISHQDHIGSVLTVDAPLSSTGSTIFISVANRVWDPIGLTWVAETQPGGGGGGGAVTVADGADVTQGVTTDAAVVSDVSGTVSGKLRGLVKMIADMWDSVNHRLNVAVSNSPTVNQGTAGTVKWLVDGSGVTQPVSGTVTANAGTNLNTSLLALESGGHLANVDTSTARIPPQGQALSSGSMPVVLPAAQITTLTPPAAITGFALETGHLANIDASTAKIPAQGAAVTAASMPVNIASDQAALPLPTNAAQESSGNLSSIGSLARTRNSLLLQELAIIQSSFGGAGFIPVELPPF